LQNSATLGIGWNPYCGGCGGHRTGYFNQKSNLQQK
jgi:hypothetical protein